MEKNPNKKCLIIEGARQVGKTFSIDKFANDNYAKSHYIKINFEKDINAKEIFARNLDADTIIANIKIMFRNKIIKKNQTLLFLDEIQVCPQAITALKFLAIDKTLDVIVSGSLLGVSYALVSSFPVGYVERIKLKSMDFEELLWANDFSDEMIEGIKLCFKEKCQVNEGTHNIMMDMFVKYIVIGGMPEVVNNYISTKDYNLALKIQERILNDYRDDIAKYATKAEKVRARECFESIPVQLAKDYKKFQYKYVVKSGRSSMFEGSIQRLVDSGIVNKCTNLTVPMIPFIGYKRIDAFKIYMADTGLLVGMLGEDAQTTILTGNRGIFKGGIFENIIADILSKSGKELYYFERNSTLEIEFILSINKEITAIEVKSADNTKSKSLNTLLLNKEIDKGIKLSMKNFHVDEKMERYPLYMAMFL